MYSAEDTQVARTIELNDGTRMPVLGLGTWKVALTLIPISALYSTKNPVVISVFSCRLFNVLNAIFSNTRISGKRVFAEVENNGF